MVETLLTSSLVREMILPFLLIFAVTFAISKFVSLGSILSSLVFMITILTTDVRAEKWPVVLFAVAVPLIIIYTHRQNIRRLINGTESKMSLGKK